MSSPLRTDPSMHSDWIFSEDELQHTPSRQEGITYLDELELRRRGCTFIDKMGKKLDMPKLALNCAHNYLHRFFMRESMVRHDKYVVAAACVLLGSKAEECVKKISHIAKEYISVRRDVEKDQRFALQKHDPRIEGQKILNMEIFVLHTLVYDLSIAHPYKFINEKVDKVVRLFPNLTSDGKKMLSGKIKQVAWSFLNDSAYTTACLRMETWHLAAGAVYVAGLYENYVPPHLQTSSGEPWYTVLGTSYGTLQDAATHLLAAYTTPYLQPEVLPATLAKLVYVFHPPKCPASTVGESPNTPSQMLTPQSDSVASPMDSAACVTSPECNGTSSKSPLDADLMGSGDSPIVEPFYVDKKRSREGEDFEQRKVRF